MAAPTPGPRDKWLAGVSLALLALWMSLHGHHRGGVLVGAALVFAAVVGILGLMGDSPLDVRGDERAPSDDAAPRPWWRREGLLTVLFGALLYVPLAGAYGLWDPWETHYSEVAREVLARDDWITLWWAQEGWFMSKPILIFWMSALGMGVGTLFGLHYQADAGPNIQEWFIRLPVSALAIAAMYALYRAVARSWGPRAGLLVAMVLGTMPHWFFLAHQAMTDMPFVASLVIAMAMLMLAITDDPDAVAEARVFTVRGRRFRVSLWHLAVGFTLAVALPQVVYLLTRPIMFGCPDDAIASQCGTFLARNRVLGLQFPIELFYQGSAGNSGATEVASAVGSPRWERIASAVPFFPSVVQGLLWLGVLLWTLPILRAERKVMGLHYVLFYAWCAISTMGKGPAGLAIPGAVALLHFAASGRWREIKRIRLGLGILVFLLVGMPWYVAISGRLGGEFIQRFVVHDLINRATQGVHGDTGSVRYFLWQLGYSMFPWSGLVPVALVGWRYVVPPSATAAQRDVARMGLLWFMLAFVLFSAIITKFHHYIFPAIPGAAILVGLLLDRLMGDARARDGDFFDRAAPTLLQAGSLVVAVVGAARLVGSFSGRLPPSGAVAPNVPFGVALLVAAAALWLVGLRLHRARELTVASSVESSRGDAKNYREQEFREVPARVPEDPAVSAGVGGLAIGAAALVAFVARDLAITRGTPPGAERLIHLFVYNYDRPWPSRFLDFHGALFGFGVAAVASLVLLAARPARAYAARGVLVLASLFAVWGLDVYMIQVTPHWTQRPLFERYYAMRRPATRDPRYPFDPIVGHQMNWKGENFYTGNHVVAEECGLKYCTGSTADFVRDHPNQRVFFVTEHTRVSALLATIRNTGGDGHTVTTEADDNKFVLVEARTGGTAAGAAPAPSPSWRPPPSEGR